ncbi:MAG: AAA family ATPase [Bacteriovoracaceae bacterium]|nr:AAA family ATPase [Bacteriovoracaceae bacterium]
MFVGREFELQELEDCFLSKRAQLAVITGRRRIGKSELVKKFAKDKDVLSFEALEKGRMLDQIKHFIEQLSDQVRDPFLGDIQFRSWKKVFHYLSTHISTRNNRKKKKTVIFFDEFQWMAQGKSNLVSLLKYYWDNHWKSENVMVILCGSIASFMVGKVVKSKALYGRITLNLVLKELSGPEIFQMLGKKRDKTEILKYLLVVGGVPKYLESINTAKSFEQNMNSLFFKTNSLLKDEFEKIFYSQFKETALYTNIIESLANGPKSLKDLCNILEVTSGGGVKSYLENLTLADFIMPYSPYNKGSSSKNKKYKISDSYLIFYLKYIRPNLAQIEANKSKDLFSILVKSVWATWLGFAFENYCMKNAMALAEKMGFADYVVNFGPYFRRGDKNFQIDLLFERSDKTITLCELKYYNKLIGTSIIGEVQKKCDLLHVPFGHTLEKALVTTVGIDQSTANLDYFHHVLTIDDLM